MPSLAIWITGLPGSGKSALADSLVRESPALVVLRMDDLRAVATPEPEYSERERDVLYRALVFTAWKLTEAGLEVIIDATANRRRWRDLARKLMPRFAEVYLSCPLDVCRQREKQRTIRRGAPADIYEKAAKGWPVPGVNVEYEVPRDAELVIDTSESTLQEATAAAIELVKRMRDRV